MAPSELTTSASEKRGDGTASRFDEEVERRGTGSLKWDKYAGRDVLPFWVADMDFRSPDEVVDAVRARADQGVFGYGKPLPSLGEAVVQYLSDRHGVTADPDWIVWLPGLVPALNMACRAAGDQRAGIMTCTPVYPPFLSAPGNADRILIDVPLKHSPSGWTFDFEAMEAAIKPDTKLFILCNPHNPTGRVYSADELSALTAFCERHDLILCADEIHCDLILEDGLKHVSAARDWNPIPDRTITLMAPSKTYNTPGLGFSFAIIPNPKLRTRFRRSGQGFLAEINVTAPFAAEAAYRHGEPWRRELIAYLRANRDHLYAFIEAEIPEFKLDRMEATYLAWIDARALDVQDPITFFEEHGVGLSDGTFFGRPGYIRFNFGCTRALMLEGLERMQRAVASLR